MDRIQRFGVTQRWSDIVIQGSTAHFVEVADDRQQDTRSQVSQILLQIDTRLAAIGADRKNLLQVVIYLADIADAEILNELWDNWVPMGHAPVRACVQAGLTAGLRVEMVVTAAVGAS